MENAAKPEIKLQRLESLDDFDLLTPGDIVPTGHMGPRLDGPMLVSHDSYLVQRGLMLIQRYTNSSIYRVGLRKKDISVVNGELKFDFKKGEKISILGDYDWPLYEDYRIELENAGLE